MTRSRSLYLAIAIFTLVVQVAAAGHSPALHDEPVSKCHDPGAHFCPEVVDHETGPCVLCTISLNGIYVERISQVPVDFVTGPVAAAPAAPLDAEPFSALRSPRGPPVG